MRRSVAIGLGAVAAAGLVGGTRYILGDRQSYGDLVYNLGTPTERGSHNRQYIVPGTDRVIVAEVSFRDGNSVVHVVARGQEEGVDVPLTTAQREYKIPTGDKDCPAIKVVATPETGIDFGIFFGCKPSLFPKESRPVRQAAGLEGRVQPVGLGFRGFDPRAQRKR
jgi:hypothetical protein